MSTSARTVRVARSASVPDRRGDALTDPRARSLLFVTGKGGVGKTTVAAALAVAAGSEGRRVLVVEIDAAGALAATFEVSGLGFDPRRVASDAVDVEALTIDTESALSEYLALFVKVPFIGRIGPVARLFDYVAQAAPGVREILTLGKICHEVRRGVWDLVVVDAPATGHVVEHLTAPSVIGDLVRVGMVRDQTAWMLDILEDPARTGVVVVTTPEETPVNETLELVERLGRETAIDVAAVVANRVLPEPFGPREQRVVDGLGEVATREVLRDLLGPGAEAVHGACRLAVTRRRMAVEHLARLRRELPETLPMVLVPEVRTPEGARARVDLIATHLAEELDVEPTPS